VAIALGGQIVNLSIVNLGRICNPPAAPCGRAARAGCSRRIAQADRQRNLQTGNCACLPKSGQPPARELSYRVGQNAQRRSGPQLHRGCVRRYAAARHLANQQRHRSRGRSGTGNNPHNRRRSGYRGSLPEGERAGRPFYGLGSNHGRSPAATRASISPRRSRQPATLSAR